MWKQPGGLDVAGKNPAGRFAICGTVLQHPPRHFGDPRQDRAQASNVGCRLVPPGSVTGPGKRPCGTTMQVPAPKAGDKRERVAVL